MLGFLRRPAALFAAALACGAFLGVATQAPAYHGADATYCNVLLDPDWWGCTDYSHGHTYHLTDRNTAHYHGDGSVIVCQRMVDSNGTIRSRSCDPNSTTSGTVSAAYLMVQVANGSCCRHTVWGHFNDWA